MNEIKAPRLPDRDPQKPAEQQGLFEKFRVQRLDGSDQPGGKHFGCRYFVLDVDHDRHARAALAAYAAECEATHPDLARDLREKWGATPAYDPLMVNMGPPATSRDRWMYEQGRLAERDPRSHASAQPAASAEPVQLAWRVVDRETGAPRTDWIDGAGGDQNDEPPFSGGLVQRAFAAPVAAQPSVPHAVALWEAINKAIRKADSGKYGADASNLMLELLDDIGTIPPADGQAQRYLHPTWKDGSIKGTLLEEITFNAPIDCEGGEAHNEPRYIITAAQLNWLEQIEEVAIRAQHSWIPDSERRPENGEHVEVRARAVRQGGKLSSQWIVGSAAVTHWRPLQSKPAQQDADKMVDADPSDSEIMTIMIRWAGGNGTDDEGIAALRALFHFKSTQTDPAMAGDEWENELISLVKSLLASSQTFNKEKLEAIRSHARKRVQPASGENLAYSALRELVRLKEIKGRMSRSQTITEAEKQDYERNKPLAWERARSVLADASHAATMPAGDDTVNIVETLAAASRALDERDVLRKSLAASQDRVKSLEVDAARYRKARTMPLVFDLSARVGRPRPDKFDALIDAAMQQREQP